MKRTDSVFGMSNEILEDSYVDRGHLDKTLSKLLSRKVHIAIRGPSKTGKSWLRQRAIKNALVVQCRHGYKVENIYTDALAALNIKIKISEATQTSFKGQIEAAGEFGTQLIAKVKSKAIAEGSLQYSANEEIIGKDLSDLKFIADLILSADKRLVIEDLHYLSIDQQEALAFELKTLWDFGCFVAVVGVWGTANLLVHLNHDIAGRIEEITVEWQPDELRQIILNGCQALKIEVSREIQNRAISDAFGNAGLLQRIILRLLDDEAGIENELQDNTVLVDQMSLYESAAMYVADQLNGVYLAFAERLARGIRQKKNSTGIYAHTMAVIIEAADGKHMTGIHLDEIFDKTHARQPRIQKPNLNSILKKLDGLQVDKNGRGLVVTYDVAEQRVLNVDRQLLFYRKYITLPWPWEELIKEADTESSSYEADNSNT